MLNLNEKLKATFCNEAVHKVCYINPLQLSMQNLKHVVQPLDGVGARWAAAMVWLHRISTGSVEKGRGLKPVTSVAAASPLTAFCRGRWEVVHMQRKSSCWPVVPKSQTAARS